MKKLIVRIVNTVLTLAVILHSVNCVFADVSVVKSYYMLKYEYQSFITPLTRAGAKEEQMLKFFADVETELNKVEGLSKENVQNNLSGIMVNVATYREHRALASVIFDCYGEEINEYTETKVVPEKLRGVYEAFVRVLFGENEADKTMLVETYEKYKLIADKGLSAYTDDSAKEFRNALSLALSVLSDKEAIQSDVDSAVATLEVTYENLEKKPNTNTGGGGGGGVSAPVVKPTATPAATESPSAAPTATPEISENEEIIYKDVNKSYWGYEAISYLSSIGITDGFEDGTFRPDQLLTREQFAKMVCEAFDLSHESEGMSFTDVADDAWYKEYIDTVSEKKIMQGMDDGSFGVGGTLIRQDMALVVYRMINGGIISEVKNKPEHPVIFTDTEKISDYAAEAVDYVRINGIMNGMDNDEFSPLTGVTRAQAAQIIYSLIK